MATKQKGHSQKVEDEINKCILLCSNCHRELEGGLWTAEFVKRDGLGWTVKPNSIKEILLDVEHYEFLAHYKYAQKSMF